MKTKTNDGKPVKIDTHDWQWFGNAGHFICSAWCRFHLATKVGDWMISTVGEYVHPRHSNGNEVAESKWLVKNPLGEDIGYGRKFETMVFKVSRVCECGCGIPKIDGTEEECEPYNDRASANAGHLKMCQKYATLGITPRKRVLRPSANKGGK